MDGDDRSFADEILGGLETLNIVGSTVLLVEPAMLRNPPSAPGPLPIRSALCQLRKLSRQHAGVDAVAPADCRREFVSTEGAAYIAVPKCAANSHLFQELFGQGDRFG